MNICWRRVASELDMVDLTVHVPRLGNMDGLNARGSLSTRRPAHDFTFSDWILTRLHSSCSLTV